MRGEKKSISFVGGYCQHMVVSFFKKIMILILSLWIERLLYALSVICVIFINEVNELSLSRKKKS